MRQSLAYVWVILAAFVLVAIAALYVTAEIEERDAARVKEDVNQDVVPSLPTPTPVPARTSLYVDVDGTSFFNPSLTVAEDGQLFISYVVSDRKNGTRQSLATCTPLACASANIQQTEPFIGNIVGCCSAVVLGPEGVPAVAYLDAAEENLMILQCHTKVCSQPQSRILDSEGRAGYGAAMAMDRGGAVTISHYGENQLKLVRCSDFSCRDKVSKTVLHKPLLVHNVGSARTAIAIGRDNLPVIAYYGDNGDFDNGHHQEGGLYLMRCVDPACAEDPTITKVETDTVGLQLSMVLDSLDRPVIAYIAATGVLELRLLRCGDPVCSAGNSIRSLGTRKTWPALALDKEDRPRLAYISEKQLKFLVCPDPTCSGIGEETVISLAEPYGAPSLILNDDDFAIIAYTPMVDLETRRRVLALVVCRSASCSP